MLRKLMITFLVLVPVIATSAFAAGPGQSQTVSGEEVVLDTQALRLHLTNSRYHLESNGNVSMLLKYRVGPVCTPTYFDVVGYSEYPRMRPIIVHPRGCRNNYKTVIAPVAGLKRVADEVVYTAANGEQTVCASLRTRTNWLGRTVVTFYPNGNCRVKTTRNNSGRVATLVVR